MKPDEGSGRDIDAWECATFFSQFSHDTINKQKSKKKNNKNLKTRRKKSSIH